MDKKFLAQQKKRLEKEKEKLEKSLSSFAQKSKKVEGGWIIKYPKFDGGELEEEADEVEEYGNLLSISYTLEKELKRITESLKKIKKGSYGICEKCKKPISKERLRVYPQANLCQKCQ